MKNKKSMLDNILTNKGFTLIELLVVIGIIAILAAVIVASLSSGRDKSVDAAIKSSLINARTQAQLFYDKNGNSYATASSVCSPTVGTLFADPTIAAQIVQVDDQNGTSANSIVCSSTSSAFAIASVLKTNTSKAYCIDATNAGKIINLTTAGAASTAITASYCN